MNVEFVIDVLSFGILKVIDNVDKLEKKLNIIGPDIMDDTTTYNIFKSRWKNIPVVKLESYY